MKYIIISYDISNNKTRTRIANMLTDYGTRVQYSVFECRIDTQTLEKLTQQLTQQLKPLPGNKDSIRIYQICETCMKKINIIGKGKTTSEPITHII